MDEQRIRLPSDLRKRSRTEQFGPVPAMLVEAEGDRPDGGAPMVVWLHGRTASKELDPGRYLRLMRAGISVCALDLPGHGDRYDAMLQDPRNVLEVILQMVDELDQAVAAAVLSLGADGERLGIGGISAGGMVAIARLTRPHPYSCCVLEATTGSWSHQLTRPMFRQRDPDSINEIDPINHLQQWRSIPVLAVHSRADEWVDWEGQAHFLTALKQLDGHPDCIETLIYERTGAEHEHVGFGPRSAEVKERERDFYARHLLPGVS